MIVVNDQLSALFTSGQDKSDERKFWILCLAEQGTPLSAEGANKGIVNVVTQACRVATFTYPARMHAVQI